MQKYKQRAQAALDKAPDRDFVICLARTQLVGCVQDYLKMNQNQYFGMVDVGGTQAHNQFGAFAPPPPPVADYRTMALDFPWLAFYTLLFGATEKSLTDPVTVEFGPWTRRQHQLYNSRAWHMVVALPSEITGHPEDAPSETSEQAECVTETLPLPLLLLLYTSCRLQQYLFLQPVGDIQAARVFEEILKKWGDVVMTSESTPSHFNALSLALSSQHYGLLTAVLDETANRKCFSALAGDLSHFWVRALPWCMSNQYLHSSEGELALQTLLVHPAVSSYLGESLFATDDMGHTILDTLEMARDCAMKEAFSLLTAQQDEKQLDTHNLDFGSSAAYTSQSSSACESSGSWLNARNVSDNALHLTCVTRDVSRNALHLIHASPFYRNINIIHIASQLLESTLGYLSNRQKPAHMASLVDTMGCPQGVANIVYAYLFSRPANPQQTQRAWRDFIVSTMRVRRTRPGRPLYGGNVLPMDPLF